MAKMGLPSPALHTSSTAMGSASGLVSLAASGAASPSATASGKASASCCGWGLKWYL